MYFNRCRDSQYFALPAQSKVVLYCTSASAPVLILNGLLFGRDIKRHLAALSFRHGSAEADGGGSGAEAATPRN